MPQVSISSRDTDMRHYAPKFAIVETSQRAIALFRASQPCPSVAAYPASRRDVSLIGTNVLDGILQEPQV
jgi:hypothetical protein